mgnify:CR=1 FL=1
MFFTLTPYSSTTSQICCFSPWISSASTLSPNCTRSAITVPVHSRPRSKMQTQILLTNLHIKTPSILKYFQYGREIERLYRLANKYIGIIGLQHITNNRCNLKFRYNGINSAAGAGHLITDRTVLMEQGFDVVQFQMLLSHHRIEYIAHIEPSVSPSGLTWLNKSIFFEFFMISSKLHSILTAYHKGIK